MPLCTRCDRTFNTIRGLDIHQNRAHPVSDSYVLDFLNLDEIQQELVLCMMDGDGDGAIAYARNAYGSAKARINTFNEIVSNPLDADRRARLKEALTGVTQIEYRYMISEEP